jgi:hypothetical protein
MSEQVNAYSRLDRTYSNTPVYHQRLSENIKRSQLYGDTDELKAERCRIINELNKLAMCTVGTSFEELSTQVVPTEGQESTESVLHINDPLSLANLSSEQPVRLSLKEIEEARSRSNWEETLRLCNSAKRLATEHGDQTGTAIALLYLADAQARTGHLKEGIATAERARKLLRMQRDYHNVIVAHILLARFKAEQSLDDAKLEYSEALGFSRKLEAEAHAIKWDNETRSYQQISEEIRLALEYIETVITEQFTRKALLHPASRPKPRDGPDTAPFKYLNSTTVDYVTIGELMIRGRKYHLYPLDTTPGNGAEINTSAFHFALPVPEEGWPDLAGQKGDYLLVRQEQVIQEGPGVLWTGEKWMVGRFERDATSGEIHFAQKPHIIGSPMPNHSFAFPVVALLKSKSPSDPVLILHKEYRFLVDVLPSNLSDFGKELGQFSVIGEPGEQPAIDFMTPVRLPYGSLAGIDVTVHAEDMDISPRWIHGVKPPQRQDSSLLEFTLIPREVGHKRIEVEFYHQRRWLAHIRFETEVVNPDE